MIPKFYVLFEIDRMWSHSSLAANLTLRHTELTLVRHCRSNPQCSELLKNYSTLECFGCVTENFTFSLNVGFLCFGITTLFALPIVPQIYALDASSSCFVRQPVVHSRNLIRKMFLKKFNYLGFRSSTLSAENLIISIWTSQYFVVTFCWLTALAEDVRKLRKRITVTQHCQIFSPNCGVFVLNWSWKRLKMQRFKNSL